LGRVIVEFYGECQWLGNGQAYGVLGRVKTFREGRSHTARLQALTAAVVSLR